MRCEIRTGVCNGAGIGYEYLDGGVRRVATCTACRVAVRLLQRDVLKDIESHMSGTESRDNTHTNNHRGYNNEYT
jgi:hypothetical protein